MIKEILRSKLFRGIEVEYMKNKKMLIAIICGLIAIFLCCALILDYILKKKNGEVTESLKNVIIDDSTDSEETKETETEVKDEYLEKYNKKIDFEELWAINKDVYAWIEIPGTEVSYPLLQHERDDEDEGEDDLYYLEHTIDKINGLPGSIYTEPTWTSKDFRDFNTVVYGHEMRDDTMFGSLNNFKKEEYRKEHDEIVIYTPDETIVYKLYAAVVYTNDHILYSYEEGNIEASKAFLESIDTGFDKSNYINEEIEIGTDDNLITLSTCITSQPHRRYIIVGVAQNIKK